MLLTGLFLAPSLGEWRCTGFSANKLFPSSRGRRRPEEETSLASGEDEGRKVGSRHRKIKLGRGDKDTSIGRGGEPSSFSRLVLAQSFSSNWEEGGGGATNFELAKKEDMLLLLLLWRKRRGEKGKGQSLFWRACLTGKWKVPSLLLPFFSVSPPFSLSRTALSRRYGSVDGKSLSLPPPPLFPPSCLKKRWPHSLTHSPEGCLVRPPVFLGLCRRRRPLTDVRI